MVEIVITDKSIKSKIVTDLNLIFNTHTGLYAMKGKSDDLLVAMGALAASKNVGLGVEPQAEEGDRFFSPKREAAALAFLAEKIGLGKSANDDKPSYELSKKQKRNLFIEFRAVSYKWLHSVNEQERIENAKRCIKIANSFKHDNSKNLVLSSPNP